jgi:hypothetical protein
MGIDVRLENAAGDALATLLDFEDSLATLILEVEPRRSAALRFVDAYGNTVFNRLQIPFLIRELERARERQSDPVVLRFADDLLALARRGRDEVDTYLKFYGG